MKSDAMDFAMDLVTTHARPVVDSLVRRVLELDDGVDPLVGETSDILLHKIDHMPQPLGAGMLALTLLFDASGAVAGGHTFRAMDAGAQRRHIERWRSVPLGRDFVAFYEKMGVFVYYSRREGE